MRRTGGGGGNEAQGWGLGANEAHTVGGGGKFGANEAHGGGGGVGANEAHRGGGGRTRRGGGGWR